MSRPLFALIVVAVITLVFLAMWLGWRARARRDSAVRPSQQAPEGALLAEFARVLYVSTTPVGEPLARVAAPGLRYRGSARVAVFEGGVTVEIAGEDPLHFAASQLRGSGSAGRRVGKAVESGGLALMRWNAEGDRALESSFRFESGEEQRRFAVLLDQISPVSASTNATIVTSQEDEK